MKLFIALALSLITLMPCSNAASLSVLRDRVDAFLLAKWPLAVARQDAYALAHNSRYWQGIITHLSIPAHTSAANNDTLPDNFAVAPHDQASSFLLAFPEWSAELWPAALKVDVYDGPLGVGWFATLYIRHNGTLYSRCQQVGPETWRSYAWRVESEGEL